MPSNQKVGNGDVEIHEDPGAIDADELLQHGCQKEEFKEMKEIIAIIQTLPQTFQIQVDTERNLEKFIFIINQYQEQPHLLDPHLAEVLGALLSIVRDTKSHQDLVHLVFKYMYIVTKTRGFKVIIKLMPHEVVDLEPILDLLQEQEKECSSTWETRYMLLVWLSIVCMIPFDMDRLNKKSSSETPMMDRILDTAKDYLGVFDKSRDAAAYLLSKFLTRPDVKERRLAGFVEWSLQIVVKVNVEEQTDLYWLYGVLTTFGLLFKHGKREDLLTIAPNFLEKLSELNLMTCKSSFMRKLQIKVIQRLGLGFLKARQAAWRYQRGNRSLVENLGGKSSVIGPISQNTELLDEDDDEYDIPEQLETIIEQILVGLGDKDTVVRWSAAKGVGRLSGRLPRELADEVLGSILELFSDLSGDEAWHGGCLALAELGRRGLLLPNRLPDVIPIVLKALLYDEKRGNFSVGAHVRDSACYVCWAFARAYDPAEIKPYVESVASALIICSILDRDINVRRAAAAAFQENVGRQGQFPHGIDILTTCDYFAVGSKSRCYQELSVFIGQYPEYIITLIEHLVEVKLVHWDATIRELSSQALHNLCQRAPEHLAEKSLPKLMSRTANYDLSVRHGSTLGAAHIIHGLFLHSKKSKIDLKNIIPQSVLTSVESVVKQLTEANLFKGLSGEYMRIACSYLIQQCSLAGLEVAESVVEIWREFLDSCLYHLAAAVRTAAVGALPAFIKQYFTPKTCAPIIEKFCRELLNPLETARMGFALAIGALPKFVLVGSFRAVTSALIACITSSNLPACHAEARRDAVKALANVCLEVDVQSNGNPNYCICEVNVCEIYDTLFYALRDYTIDQARGDIGAYVREAAINALLEITRSIVFTHPGLLTPPIVEITFCQIIQQANEKIDRLRFLAGETFIQLLYNEPEIPNVPDVVFLKRVFSLKALGIDTAVLSKGNKTDSNSLNYLPYIGQLRMGDVTFSLFASLLGHKLYVKPVLLGFAISVGGLTESLVHHSRTALFSFMKSHQDNADVMDRFSSTLLEIFAEYHKDGRVIIPALKMLDQLLDNDCFAIYTDEGNEFPMKLLNCLKKEMANASDPNKILAVIDVYCGLIQFPGEIRSKVLFSIMLLLAHRYPRIRKKVANKLYETLLMYDDVTDEVSLEEVMKVLSETLWEKDLSEIRPIRNDICDLLKVPKPVMKNKN